jgi:hypothetical protein
MTILILQISRLIPEYKLAPVYNITLDGNIPQITIIIIITLTTDLYQLYMCTLNTHNHTDYISIPVIYVYIKHT